MKTVHNTTIVARCPHGGPDVYEAEFHVLDECVTVEAIQAVIDAAVDEPIYQEHLTQRPADQIGCLVVTTGRHGRFLTACRAEPQ